MLSVSVVNFFFDCMSMLFQHLKNWRNKANSPKLLKSHDDSESFSTTTHVPGSKDILSGVSADLLVCSVTLPGNFPGGGASIFKSKIFRPKKAFCINRYLRKCILLQCQDWAREGDRPPWSYATGSAILRQHFFDNEKSDHLVKYSNWTKYLLIAYD